MSLSEEDRSIIDSFAEYVEDSVGHDERYGRPQRIEHEDESVLAVRFDAGSACWLEVAVLPADRKVRVGFVIDDELMYEEIREGGEDGAGSVCDLLELGFREAGLDWTDQLLESYPEDGPDLGFAVSFELDDLDDLDRVENRDRALRMLEALLVAFGAVVEATEDE